FGAQFAYWRSDFVAVRETAYGPRRFAQSPYVEWLIASDDGVKSNAWKASAARSAKGALRSGASCAS
ncbi:MAG: hypothetical protein ACI8QF_002090, partial [Limisphaerales bacterium]